MVRVGGRLEAEQSVEDKEVTGEPSRGKYSAPMKNCRDQYKQVSKISSKVKMRQFIGQNPY